MKACFLLLIIVACNGASIDVEKNKVAQEKRGTEGEGYAGQPSSYSHVVQSHQNRLQRHQPYNVPIQRELVYPQGIERHPQQVSIAVPIQAPVDRPYQHPGHRPYVVQLIPRHQYEKPPPLPVKVVEQPEFVLTRVPLVFHATYPQEPVAKNVHGQEFTDHHRQHLPPPHQPLFIAQPHQIVYENNYA